MECYGFYFTGATKKHVNPLLTSGSQGALRLLTTGQSNLWPEIERQRTQVACYDLLTSIEPDLRGVDLAGNP